MLKLDHVVFPVRDAERTMAFYREILGLPLIGAVTGDDWGGHAWLMLAFGLEGGQEIVAVALEGAPAPDHRGLPIDARHYALACGGPAELEAWRLRLAKAKIDFWEERHGEGSSVYFADPDGVILEMTWPPAAAGRLEMTETLDKAWAWIAKAKAPA